ncbi:DUF3515 family protein [Amnibacterium sp.]|uniref:DUF3515 family protein n=1 Tax=Amnibacterium sp. TaxID=1872496 RepID=UPI003F7C7FAE
MRRGLLLPVALVPLLLAGCTSTVAMHAAPQATSVGCAGVIVRLPEAIGAATRRTTDAQGTAAWGTPASVTLTCGVTTPAVTGTPCQTVAGVDWLLGEQRIGGADRQVLTTYGRRPGTQVVVDPSAVDAVTVLDALSDPVAAATSPTGVRCLSATSGTA